MWTKSRNCSKLRMCITSTPQFLGFFFLTNIPCWKCVDDFAQLPGKFREFLNKIESDERPGDCTITMDEVAGTGFEIKQSCTVGFRL